MSGPQYITGDHVTKIMQGLPTRPVTDREYEEKTAERKAKRIEARTKELLSKSNAPQRHLKTKADMAGPFKDRFDKVSEMRKTGYLVAFIGAWGAGKTQLAVELMKHRAKQGGRTMYHTAMELLMMFKATYSSTSKGTEMDVMKALARPELLVVDEAAKRGETEWENRLLFEVLNKRYADFKDTILIANQTREDFTRSMGPSVVRRMDETGGLMVF